MKNAGMKANKNDVMHSSQTTAKMSDKSKEMYIEREARLSHSIVWQWQRDYYKQYGVNAWSHGTVASFISSNALIAKQYATQIVAFLNDIHHHHQRAETETDASQTGAAIAEGRTSPRRTVRSNEHSSSPLPSSPSFRRSASSDRLDQSTPVYIVEVGAGSGKLSFLILQHLWRMRDHWLRKTCDDREGISAKRHSPSPISADVDDENDDSDDEDSVPHCCPFIYIISDSTPANVDFIRHHPSMQSFIRRGMVDFALIDAEKPLKSDMEREVDGEYAERCPSSPSMDASIFLLHRRTHLTPNTNTKPIFLVANYVFSSLRADAFRIVRVPNGQGEPHPDDSRERHVESSTSNQTPPASRPSHSKLQLQECCLSVRAPTHTYVADPWHDSSLISRCTYEWKYRDVRGASMPLPHQSPVAGKGQANVISSLDPSAPAPSPIDYYSGQDSDLNSLLSTLIQQFVHHTMVERNERNSPALNVEFDCAFMVPVGAIRCLRAVLALSHHNLVVLCGDKLYTRFEEMLHSATQSATSSATSVSDDNSAVASPLRTARRFPHLALHGSFSFMFNMYILQLWMEQQYGDGAMVHMHTESKEAFRISMLATMRMGWMDRAKGRQRRTRNDALQIGASSPSLSLRYRFSSMLPSLALAFSSSFHPFTPDAFCSLQQSLYQHASSSSLPLASMVSLLRLAEYDARVFRKFSKHIMQHVQVSMPNTNPQSLLELRSMLPRIAATHYPYQCARTMQQTARQKGNSNLLDSHFILQPPATECDVWFDLGRLSLLLNDASMARAFFQRSIYLNGSHASTYFNLGLCHALLEEMDDARHCFNHALELDSKHEEAREWMKKLEEMMDSKLHGVER